MRSLGRPTAGKTGTTNNYVDAWFLGYTPRLLTGVWVGKDNDEPLGKNETGSRAAIPIWLEYMKNALANTPVHNFSVSPETVFIKVNPETGNLTDSEDSEGHFEIFLQDNLPDKQSNSLKVITDNTF